MRQGAGSFRIGWLLGGLAGLCGFGLVISRILSLPEKWQEAWPLVSLAVMSSALLIMVAFRRRSGPGDAAFLVGSTGIIVSLVLILLLFPFRALPWIWIHMTSTLLIALAAVRMADWWRQRRRERVSDRPH